MGGGLVSRLPRLICRFFGRSLANLVNATDPIVQAEVDAEKQGKRSSADGKAKGFWKQSASRLKTFAAC
jgi:hypothetical protein